MLLLLLLLLLLRPRAACGEVLTRHGQPDLPAHRQPSCRWVSQSNGCMFLSFRMVDWSIILLVGSIAGLDVFVVAWLIVSPPMVE